ncbi:MAG: hypothetical protein LC797_13775 [Chloroflexi bacterium]|nr:hypothetical protein [Chloroflexota bacterium]
MWRRRAALGVIGAWALVALARAPRLIEPAEAPPGVELAPLLDFLRVQIPPTDGYLFILPGEFGTDTGVGQRLRYELYPRPYDDVRAAPDESTIRQLTQVEGLRFIVVPDANGYPPTYWLRQPRDWLKRIDFDAARYLLQVVA